MLGNARHDRTRFQTVVNLELQQLVCLRYFLAFEDRSYADIQLCEVVKFDVYPNRIRLITGFFVCFLRVKQLLYLCFYCGIFDLFEQ